MDIDIDKDVDGKLAQQFGCITTADRETLIRNFRRILNSNNNVDCCSATNGALINGSGECGRIVNDGNKSKPDLHHQNQQQHSTNKADLINQETCIFFLDMNNWNLPAALGSFYDFNVNDADLLQTPNMIFVEDVTIGEGESVSPSTTFVKTWRLKNSGSFRWPDGCVLCKCTEESGLDVCLRFEHLRVEVPCRVEPGQIVDLSVKVTTPSCVGVFQSMWRLMTPKGVPFGDHIWCILIVENAGLLDITQKLAATHVKCEPKRSSPVNIFCPEISITSVDDHTVASVQTDSSSNEQTYDNNSMEN